MNFSWWTCSFSSLSRELCSWGNTFSLKYSQTDNPSWTLNLINFFSIHVLFLVIYILIIFSKISVSPCFSSFTFISSCRRHILHANEDDGTESKSGKMTKLTKEKRWSLCMSQTTHEYAPRHKSSPLKTYALMHLESSLGASHVTPQNI